MNKKTYFSQAFTKITLAKLELKYCYDIFCIFFNIQYIRVPAVFNYL